MKTYEKAPTNGSRFCDNILQVEDLFSAIISKDSDTLKELALSRFGSGIADTNRLFDKAMKVYADSQINWEAVGSYLRSFVRVLALAQSGEGRRAASERKAYQRKKECLGLFEYGKRTGQDIEYRNLIIYFLSEEVNGERAMNVKDACSLLHELLKPLGLLPPKSSSRSFLNGHRAWRIGRHEGGIPKGLIFNSLTKDGGFVDSISGKLVAPSRKLHGFK